MQKKINLGLIGAGRITGHHIRAIKKNNNLKILAICDLDILKAKKYALKNNLRFYSHYKDMCENEKELDVVVILTPSGMHFSHALDILRKFKKHLIIEKPTSLKTTEILQLYKLAEKIKKKIFPIFQNRYNKSVSNLKKFIK